MQDLLTYYFRTFHVIEQRKIEKITFKNPKNLFLDAILLFSNTSDIFALKRTTHFADSAFHR